MRLRRPGSDKSRDTGSIEDTESTDRSDSIDGSESIDDSESIDGFEEDVEHGAPVPPPPPPEVVRDSPDELAKPSEMQGNEELYGYIVAGELLLAALVSLASRHSAGVAANQAQTWKYVAGLLAALALVPVIRTRRRMAAGFASIIAAFVVSLPPVPKSQNVLHILALVVPLVYALLLTQRQRKAALAQGGSRRSKGSSGQSGSSTARRSGSKGSGKPSPTKQTTSGRYTPPKAKRTSATKKKK